MSGSCIERAQPEQRNCICTTCICIHVAMGVCTHKWAYLPVSIQHHPVFSREKKWRWCTQLADVDKNNQFEYWQRSVLLHLSRIQCTGCVLFLPPRCKPKKRKQQEWPKSLVWFKLVGLLCCDLHNLYGGNREARRELIRANVTADSHFSGGWLDVKFSKWVSRTHEKSSDDEGKKKKKRERGRKKRRQDDKLERIVIPFLFHRGIKSKLAGFSMGRKKNHSSIFITYYEVEELHTMIFMCFFMRLFIFHKVFVSPRQVQVFTPVKGFTQPGMRTQSFKPVTRRVELLPPKLQRISIFIMEHYFPWEKISDYSAVFCWKTERNRTTTAHTLTDTETDRLWLAGIFLVCTRAANTPKTRVISHVTFNNDSIRYLSQTVCPA